jgi:hypothetical protein
VLKNYVEALDLATLQPSPAVIHQTGGGFAYALKDAKNVVVYMEPFLSKGAALQLKLTQGSYTIEWTNAVTGEKISSSPLRVTSAIATLPLPDGEGDKVVKLSRLK